MKIKFISLLALFLSLAAASSLAAEALLIAVIPKSTDNDYWRTVHAGALKAQADLIAEGIPVTVLWEGTQREDQLEEQKNIIARFVTRKVSGIVLAPMQAAALVPPAEHAVAAKIPVVIIDSPLNSELAASTVATNNYKGGMLAGRRMADVLGGKGKVAMLRFVKGHSSTQPRESGFLDAIKKYPNIQVISSDQQAGATAEDARLAAKALLERIGAEVQGIFTPNLTSTAGMLAALREAGLAGKISFVGFDSSAAQIEALRKGEMSGMIVQQPFMMGYLGVRTAVDVIHGKTVAKEVDTEVKLVTKENLDTPEIHKLLNPSEG